MWLYKFARKTETRIKTPFVIHLRRYYKFDKVKTEYVPQLRHQNITAAFVMAKKFYGVDPSREVVDNSSSPAAWIVLLVLMNWLLLNRLTENSGERCPHFHLRSRRIVWSPSTTPPWCRSAAATSLITFQEPTFTTRSEMSGIPDLN